MVFNLKRQPLKSIYLTYQILSTLVIRIPWWTLQSTFRSVKCSQPNTLSFTALTGAGDLGNHGA